jgi:hypothetical protein
MHPRGGLRRAARSALIPRRGDRLPPVSDVAPPHSRSSSCRGVQGNSNCESGGLRKDRTCSASNVTTRGCATRLCRSIRTHTLTSRHAVYRPDFILGARQGRCDQTVGSETASSAGLSFAGDATPANVFTKLPAPFVRRRTASAGGRANSGMWRRTLHTAGCSRGKWKPARPAAKKEADVSLCAVWPADTGVRSTLGGESAYPFARCDLLAPADSSTTGRGRLVLHDRQLAGAQPSFGGDRAGGEGYQNPDSPSEEQFSWMQRHSVGRSRRPLNCRSTADVMLTRRLTTAQHGSTRLSIELAQNLGPCSTFAHGALPYGFPPEVS